MNEEGFLLYGAAVQVSTFQDTMSPQELWDLLERSKDDYRNCSRTTHVIFRAEGLEYVRAFWDQGADLTEGVRLQAFGDDQMIWADHKVTSVEQLQTLLVRWEALTLEQVRKNWEKD